MTDRRLLDRLGADGCPPLEVVEVDGWRLRAAEGVLLRANSALPLSDALPVEAVTRFYRDRGLVPRVHVSSAQVDAELGSRGWVRDTEVLVLTGPTSSGPSRAVVREAPDDAWVDAYWSVDGRGGAREREVLVRMLGRVPEPAAFVSVDVHDEVVAVGRGVAQEGHLGIYSMAVLPEARGRGYGRDVLHALGSWGLDHGARTTHLQVLSDNVPALALYGAARLRPAYGYHYRSLP